MSNLCILITQYYLYTNATITHWRFLLVTLPTWERQTNAIKFGGSAFTIMVSWLSYAKTRSVALICDSSTIKTDQGAVQLRHWYRIHALWCGCPMLSCTLLRLLTLIRDVPTFTGVGRCFDTITHAHWRKPDISWCLHTIVWNGGVLCRLSYIISLKLCPRKGT